MFYQGDLPARSGLGSSSSFTVGFLNAMYALRGQISTNQQLAAEAVYIEREILKENVGVQDQIAAAYGGFNKIDIYQDGNFDVNPVLTSNVKINELKNNLMLFFTGISRNATDIAKEQMKSLPKKTNQLKEMQKMVNIANNIVVGGSDMNDFGKLLHESWMLKRGLTKDITTDFIDDIYKKARNAGATGGKLLGAGGGGFILFFVKPEYQPKVLEALSDLLWVPFDFERRGSHVAFYSPSKFSRESLLRRDFAHLKDARKHKNVKNITNYLKDERNRPMERMTKFNIVE
jgi:D-glycero-alpha-D-manno-heptose-7-phosphate kinase